MKLNKTIDVFNCPVCGNLFVKTAEWIYKYPRRGYFGYCCTYTCWRKKTKELEEKKNNKNTRKSKNIQSKTTKSLRKYSSSALTDKEVDFCIEYAKTHSIEKTKKALFKEFGTKCSNQTVYIWARGRWTDKTTE